MWNHTGWTTVDGSVHVREFACNARENVPEERVFNIEQETLEATEKNSLKKTMICYINIHNILDDDHY